MNWLFGFSCSSRREICPLECVPRNETPAMPDWQEFADGISFPKSSLVDCMGFIGRSNKKGGPFSAFYGVFI